MLSTGSRVLVGFGTFGSWALERSLGRCDALGFVGLQHVQSSWIRDRTCVSCIGRRILFHGATGEALSLPFYSLFSTHFFPTLQFE